MKLYAFPDPKRGRAFTDDCVIAAVKLYEEENGRASDALDLSVVRDENGKPSLAGLDGTFISVTHTDGLLLVAVAPYPVGIDAEKQDRRVRHPASLARRYFTPEEAASLGEDVCERDFLDLWVRKEALSKLVGRGIPCMREASAFDARFVLERVDDYDGYLVYAARYADPGLSKKSAENRSQNACILPKTVL